MQRQERTKAGRMIVAAIAAVGMIASSVSATVTAATDAPDPTANASARSCNIKGSETDLGASYVTSLKVSDVSCGDGKGVVRAFHACRKDNGGADGKCNKSVNGYKCNEGPRDGVPGVQYNARVRCNNDGKRVIHTYTQNA